MTCILFTPQGPNGILYLPRAPGDGSYPSSAPVSLAGKVTDRAAIIRLRSNGAFWINFGDATVNAAGRKGTFIEAPATTILGIPASATHFAVAADDPGQLPTNQTLYYSVGY
ncbi:hypothetical protein [Brucella sp. IR073]|uniref:hypothetical protein n=1 Tax=unclassified Brucella TaxID=2632610 RepID=UPI003B98393A